MNRRDFGRTAGPLPAFVISLILCGAGSLGAQTTWFVDAAAPLGGSGSAASPFATIQDAIVAAASGDRVRVRPGTYHENIDLLGRDLRLESTSGAAATIIDGNAGFHCASFVNGESAACRLTGFTLTNGSAIDGGGILCVLSSPVIENCVISGNVSANDGGGIHCFGGSPLVSGCTISGNVSGIQGGGIAFVAGSTGRLENCVVDGNSSDFGGGCVGNAAMPTIAGCSFSGNQALSDGGGLRVLLGSIAVERSSFRSNSAVFGAGAGLDATSALFTQCRFFDNSSSASGGALSAAFSTLTMECSILAANDCAIFGGGLYLNATTTSLQGCTLRGNLAGIQGGGIHAFSGPDPFLGTSILWANLPDQASAQPGTSVLVDHSCVQGGFAGLGNIAVDPMHVDPAAEDFQLAPGSPCIDAGTTTFGGTTTVDVDGDPRRNGPRVDMGADEHFPFLAGSGEDLELISSVDGLGIGRTVHPAPAGSLVRLELSTPGGLFQFLPPLVIGQIFPPSSPPASPFGFPQVHVAVPGAFLLFDGSIPGPFGYLPLSSQPIALQYLIPPGLSGLAGRCQLLVASALASNGIFAITDAHELRF